MKIFNRSFFFIGGSLISQLADARQDSVQQLQQQQFQSELIRQGYENQSSSTAGVPRPIGEWVKTWGAIASGTNGSGYGVTKGAFSKKDAEKQAVSQCFAGGGENCKPTFAYQNQCVAIAQPVDDGGVMDAKASAISTDVATQDAIRACGEYNHGMACKIIYTDCTEQFFKRY